MSERMERIKELEIQQQQNERDIQAAKVEAERIAKDLKALDEPVWEHGEIGTSQYGVFFYNNRKGAGFRDRKGGFEYKDREFNSLCYAKEAKTKKLNINLFDYLSRLSEPLEEFEIDGARFVTGGTGNNIVISTRNDDPSKAFTLDETQEMIDGLQRLLHTAKKKSEKSSK